MSTSPRSSSKKKRDTADEKYGNNDDEDEDDDDDTDHLWFYHDAGQDWHNFDRGRAASWKPAMKRILVPIVLLCQAVVSLMNLLGALALVDLSSKHGSGAGFRLAAHFWLAVSYANTVLPILMLASFRMEGVLIMRIFVVASCVMLILLLISTILSVITLRSWMLSSKNSSGDVFSKSKTLYAGIIAGLCVEALNMIITAVTIYMVYEYCSVILEREKRKRAKQKSSHLSPRSKM